ncbi:GntR family transcriptional regulator [Pseudomonas luteola]|uniref:GntR family transcriptional regulator n=1 Tax=Pseudomonas luteola TaxID=47886 RepID=UPI0003008366|nr:MULTISPECIES: GntR family transcriptional regulator [Pseudomonas]MBA1247558.1 GntR family transcriptional regulator [Pseudomonas zeshuii]QEU29090.1 GntR family transcriptional regulator [Pseudomonas luteola]
MTAEDSASYEDGRAAVPRYGMIRNALRDAILGGRAEAGLVLVEAPLAQLFGTSRVPVRQALTMLYEEGLLSRFEGRGYLINPNNLELEPKRLALSRQLLGLEPIDTRPLGERVFDDISACVSKAMVFGHYRLDEQDAADYLGVSRSVVREALMRLRDRGLLEKEPYSQWLAGPLTAQAITEDYELRALLEPEALRQNAPTLTRAALIAMLERILKAQALQGGPSRQVIEIIEHDLHGQCLSGIRNRKMATLIRHSQSPMNIGRIFHEAVQTGSNEAMLIEHRLIIESLLHGAVDSAALNLRDHLIRARDRTLQRLKVISVLPDPELPGYLTRLS